MNAQKNTPDGQQKFDPFTMPPLYIHSTMREYIEAHCLEPYSVAALVWITSRANGSRGEHFEAVGNMAAGLSMSRRKAQSVLRDLEARGIIVGRTNRGRTTLYKVQPYAQWRGAFLKAGEQELLPPVHGVPGEVQQVPMPAQQEPTKVNSIQVSTKEEEQEEGVLQQHEGKAGEDNHRRTMSLIATAVYGGDGNVPKKDWPRLAALSAELRDLQPPMLADEVASAIPKVDPYWKDRLGLNNVVGELAKTRRVKRSSRAARTEAARQATEAARASAPAPKFKTAQEMLAHINAQREQGGQA